jgi:hypothetical protein
MPHSHAWPFNAYVLMGGYEEDRLGSCRDDRLGGVDTGAVREHDAEGAPVLDGHVVDGRAGAQLEVRPLARVAQLGQRHGSANPARLVHRHRSCPDRPGERCGRPPARARSRRGRARTPRAPGSSPGRDSAGSGSGRRDRATGPAQSRGRARAVGRPAGRSANDQLGLPPGPTRRSQPAARAAPSRCWSPSCHSRSVPR